MCFRHVPAALADDVERLDRYQLALQRAIEADGTAWVSVTTLRGRRWLRAGVVNYLSTEADVDALIDAIDRLSAGAIASVQNASS